MKAKEVPEEIYILPDYRYSNGLSICWYDAPYRTGAIEYIRTDAFIEKACDWIEKNGCGYWLDDSALPNRDLIEDFRNYMKGE